MEAGVSTRTMAASRQSSSSIMTAMARIMKKPVMSVSMIW